MGNWHLDPVQKQRVSTKISKTLQKISYNRDFFEVIDTEGKAYWLGYFYADGCVFSTTESGKPTGVGLTSIDADVLLSFAAAIQYPEEKIKYNIQNKTYQIVLTSVKIATDLVKLGCVIRKTYAELHLPPISEELKKHFIRGFFDGDGTLNFTNNHLTFGLCGSKPLLEEIQHLLVLNCKLKHYTKLTQNVATPTLYYLGYNGNKQAFRIFTWLYEGASVWMERKRKLFEKFLLRYNDSLLPGSGLSWFQFSFPDYKILRTFLNPDLTKASTVVLESEEMTALCPLTGYPDYYNLKISYIPDEVCVESKSVKFYLGSYRSYGGFVETLAVLVVKDWVKACNPIQVKVELTMKPRGSIGITVIKEYVRGKKIEGKPL